MFVTHSKHRYGFSRLWVFSFCIALKVIEYCRRNNNEKFSLVLFAGSKIGKFSKVSISDCDMTQSSCVLPRNTNATIGVDFILGMRLFNTLQFKRVECEKDENLFLLFYLFASFAEGVDKVDKVKSVAHGVILGIPIEFPLPNPDACKNCGLTCPLEKGKNYEYLTTLPILSSYPKVIILYFICVYSYEFHRKKKKKLFPFQNS